MWFCFIEVSLICVCVCLVCACDRVFGGNKLQDVLRLMSHSVAAATLFIVSYVALLKTHVQTG